MPGYSDTYYTATLRPAPPRPALIGNTHADVCVVGGGLAGLSTAWELLARGKSVVLLEAARLAWGASGRNGGFVSQGWAQGLPAIERRCGRAQAAALFTLSLEGVEAVRAMITRHQLPGCAPTSGALNLTRYEDGENLKRQAERMATEFNVPLEYLDRVAVQERLSTDRYFQGLRDPKGFHFHPLNYCLGVAALIERQGGALYEHSPMVRVERHAAGHRVITAHGSVACEHVVYCCGGYGGKEFGRLRRAFLPIATYVVLTEPLGERLQASIRTTDALGDDRRAGDYYRIVEGDRLLWGGHITTRALQDERRLAALLTADILDVYPQLQGLKIDKAWSGLMGYARHKMPHIGPLAPGVWACASFGGHGMNTAPIAGRVVAEAICGETDRYRLFEPFGLRWNGGPFGPVAAQLVYTGLRVMDRVQEARARRGI